MTATFDREKLDALAGEGLLKSVRHPDADLWIYNYTQRCQYGRVWTPETLACRGLIIDGDGNVVARPFPKFFNLGEPGAPKKLPTSDFTVTEKIDGSLGIFYTIENKGYIASRGSFTSDQAREGTAMLLDEEFECTINPNFFTPLFEIVYPENRIVVDYGARRELIYLGAIDRETGLNHPVQISYTGPRVPSVHVSDPRDLHGMATSNAEGFVVSWEQGAKRVKIKFDEYVRLHRIVSGINEHRVWEACRAGDDLTALEGLPDEIYSFVETTSARILREVADLRTTAERVAAEGEDLPNASRRDVAAFFFSSDANPHLCFTLYDGGDITSQLWKITEPKTVPA